MQGFEWDLAKDLENRAKHGVSFAEAVETFGDPRGIVLEDIAHSEDAARFYWVGRSRAGRVLTTRYTRRGSSIRIFGCAEWRRFRRYYESAQSEEPAKE